MKKILLVWLLYRQEYILWRIDVLDQKRLGLEGNSQLSGKRKRLGRRIFKWIEQYREAVKKFNRLDREVLS